MDLHVSKTICLLVSLSLITIFLSFSNNDITYGQVINNSAHDNSIENSTAITSGNSQDKSDKEIRNDKIVREFYSNVFFAKNASAAVNYLEEDYVQHNPNVPTGREAFINAFTQIFEQNPKFNTQIQRIYTDGDYVIVHSFAPFGETGNAIVDIYRVNDNGKIAEHWDVLQQIPLNPANNNTMFYQE
jgi:predicted SnoaL-like aldol condensation-catalyzing enzyme